MNETAPEIGTRIRLVCCTDQHTTLEPGLEGTVTFVDDCGTVFAAWDNGSRLGLVAEAGDRFEIIPGQEADVHPDR